MTFKNNEHENQTNERCYIINLRVATDYATAYVSSKWVRKDIDSSNLRQTVQTYLGRLVFGIAQSIGKYYSPPDSLQLVDDISGILDLFSVQYSIHNGVKLEDGALQTQHLKKMIEDYILQQLSAALSNHGVFNPIIKRYSARPSDDQGFLFCC